MTLDTPEPEQLSTTDNVIIIAALLSFPVSLGFVLVAPGELAQLLAMLCSLGLNSAALVRLQMIPTDATADRAQMGPSPIWIPGLLTLLVIVAIVLNEVFLGIAPARGPLADEYAHDPTSLIVLLTVAVAVLALTNIAEWYRRRRSAKQ